MFLSGLYFVLAWLRSRSAAEPPFSATERIASLGFSLVSHMVVFLGAFVAVCLARSLAGMSRNPAPLEFLLCVVLAAAAGFAAVRGLILSAVSLSGARADLFALLCGICVASALGGAALRINAGREEEAPNGLLVLLSPLAPPPRFSSAGRVAWIVGLAVATGAITVRASVMDWNYLIQKLTAAAAWVLAFAFFQSTGEARATRSDPLPLLLAGSLFGLAAYGGLEAFRPKLALVLREPDLATGSMLDRYAGYDPSYKLLRDALSRQAEDGSFYRFLQRNTNLPRTLRIGPVDVKMTPALAPSAAPKPNIFVIVIDSLRKDYLSPYNPKVRFTPSIESFAQQSVVMEDAFSRYGATGLSEPSIWAGAMLLHKQYVTPFSPMNSLEKLIVAEGYQRLVSLDTILKVLLEPSASLVDLDEGTLNKDYDLCRSLQQLRKKMSEADPARPVFAYTQPQNIHIAQITRLESVPAGEEYPGFYAPYASRLSRIDTCFGEFVRFLKDRQLFESSIVILTSDHGDCLGEEGRWGHAYLIQPEILRVPMIIHLPEKLRSRLSCDPKAIAFLTDITPTLYYLLGHRPIVSKPLFGKPLFTETLREREERHGPWLVASSYGPVYGILDRDGRSLYIADGVNFQDSLYDLTSGQGDTREPVTRQTRERYQRLIEEQVLEIARFYGFEGGAPR